MKTKNKIPMRQCTGCREMKNKKEMIRVLKTAEDEIVLDDTGKKNGRGAYICFSRECLEKARKNHGLERSLKASIPEEVYESLEKEFDSIGEQYSIIPDRTGNEGGKNRQRRIFHREIREDRQRIPGHCSRGFFREYKEEVPEYVYLLRSAFIHPF